MPRISRSVLAAWAITVLAGSCLHFLYALCPNPITALVSPVNESLWEHIKLLYWPCLLAGLFLKRRFPEEQPVRSLLLLLLPLSLLGAGYLYHVVLEGDRLVVDVALYVLLMSLYFFLPRWLGERHLRLSGRLLSLLVAVLGVLILYFTFQPPNCVLFQDLSAPFLSTNPLY